MQDSSPGGPCKAWEFQALLISASELLRASQILALCSMFGKREKGDGGEGGRKERKREGGRGRRKKKEKEGRKERKKIQDQEERVSHTMALAPAVPSLNFPICATGGWTMLISQSLINKNISSASAPQNKKEFLGSDNSETHCMPYPL